MKVKIRTKISCSGLGYVNNITSLSTIFQTKFYFIILGVLFSLILYSNPAYADLDPLPSSDNTPSSIATDYSSYMVDGGMWVTVTNPPASQKVQSGTSYYVIVQVRVDSTNGFYPGLWLKQVGNTNSYSGYIYFKNADENSKTIQYNPITVKSNLSNQPDHVQVQFPCDHCPANTAPAPWTNAPPTIGTPQNGAQEVTITTSHVDKTYASTISGNSQWGTPQGWSNIPAPNTQPSTIVMATQACSSGDFICNSWKINPPDINGFEGLKIPWINQDGSVSTTHFYKYPCDPTYDPFGLDASGNPIKVGDSFKDPQCPTSGKVDIYVQVHYMMNQRPNPRALNDVITAFANAGKTLHIQLVDTDDPGANGFPNTNPGIQLHNYTINVDPTTIAGGAGNTDFDTIKKYFGGTAGDRKPVADINSGVCFASDAAPNPATNCTYNANLTSKRQAFHYALFVHSVPTFITGASEQPGNDMSISLGETPGGNGTVDIAEGTFMHELGHNLGLQHGGYEPHNCKPNYLSVMQYSRQTSIIIPDRSLSYSPGTLTSALDEGHIYEANGVGPNNNGPLTTAQGHIAFGFLSTIDNKLYVGYGLPTGGSVDFDYSAATPENSPFFILAQISNFPQTGTQAVPGCSEITPDAYMADWPDWNNLQLNMAATSAWNDGVAVSVDTTGFELPTFPVTPQQLPPTFTATIGDAGSPSHDVVGLKNGGGPGCNGIVSPKANAPLLVGSNQKQSPAIISDPRNVDEPGGPENSNDEASKWIVRLDQSNSFDANSNPIQNNMEFAHNKKGYCTLGPYKFENGISVNGTRSLSSLLINTAKYFTDKFSTTTSPYPLTYNQTVIDIETDNASNSTIKGDYTQAVYHLENAERFIIADFPHSADKYKILNLYETAIKGQESAVGVPVSYIKHSMTLLTDKQSYNQGDVVSISGTALPTVYDTPVSLTIENSTGNVVYFEPLPLNSSDIYTTPVHLTGILNHPGTYQVYAEYASPNVVAQTSFVVQQVNQPSITIMTDHSSYRQGDQVSISGTVQPPSSGIVTVTINDPTGNVVSVSQSRLDSQSNYDTNIPTSGSMWSRDGTYQVSVHYGSLQSQTSFVLSSSHQEDQRPQQNPQTQYAAWGIGIGVVATMSAIGIWTILRKP